ncbi:MAG: hypothetical protein F6K17_40795 [Okeania sp. SIO3C4]|nr:hypothetical protein [Okeania sp. SIO3C4]
MIYNNIEDRNIFLRSVIIEEPNIGPQEELPTLFGAGGRWPVINEIIDPKVIRQQSNLSCGPACAEMLLRECGITNITQVTIENLTGVPTSASEIADALNQLSPASLHRWQGGYLDTSTSLAAFNLLLRTAKPWMAQMKEIGNRIAHMVVVDAFDETGLVLVRDPWEGTSYKMEIDQFLQVWSQIAVF